MPRYEVWLCVLISYPTWWEKNQRARRLLHRLIHWRLFTSTYNSQKHRKKTSLGCQLEDWLSWILPSSFIYPFPKKPNNQPFPSSQHPDSPTVIDWEGVWDFRRTQLWAECHPSSSSWTRVLLRLPLLVSSSTGTGYVKTQKWQSATQR